MLKKITATFFVMALMVTLANSLYAADTLETFDPGASDVEFYAGFEGIGLDKYERGISAEIALGYGLMENFSADLAISAASNEYFSGGEAEISFGIFGTPLDSDHVDIDLMLHAAVGGEGFGDFALIPGLELNFDLKADQALWGIYLVLEESLAGRDESVEDDQSTPNIDESATKFSLAPATALTIGTYYTISENHQLFLQFDSEIMNNPEDGEDTFQIGGVALGYNVVLNDYVELINEVAFDIPQNDEDFSVGINVGIVVTLPDKF